MNNLAAEDTNQQSTELCAGQYCVKAHTITNSCMSVQHHATCSYEDLCGWNVLQLAPFSLLQELLRVHQKQVLSTTSLVQLHFLGIFTPISSFPALLPSSHPLPLIFCLLKHHSLALLPSPPSPSLSHHCGTLRTAVALTQVCEWHSEAGGMRRGHSPCVGLCCRSAPWWYGGGGACKGDSHGSEGSRVRVISVNCGL